MQYTNFKSSEFSLKEGVETFEWVTGYLKASPGATYLFVGEHSKRPITFKVIQLVLVAWTQTRTYNQLVELC